MLVWNAMPSMTDVMSAILRAGRVDVAHRRDLRGRPLRRLRGPRRRPTRRGCPRAMCSPRSAARWTWISSMLAAVSSRLLACVAMRSEMLAAARRDAPCRIEHVRRRAAHLRDDAREAGRRSPSMACIRRLMSSSRFEIEAHGQVARGDPLRRVRDLGERLAHELFHGEEQRRDDTAPTTASPSSRKRFAAGVHIGEQFVAIGDAADHPLPLRHRGEGDFLGPPWIFASASAMSAPSNASCPSRASSICLNGATRSSRRLAFVARMHEQLAAILAARCIDDEVVAVVADFQLADVLLQLGDLGAHVHAQRKARRSRGPKRR